MAYNYSGYCIQIELGPSTVKFSSPIRLDFCMHYLCYSAKLVEELYIGICFIHCFDGLAEHFIRGLLLERD